MKSSSRELVVLILLSPIYGYPIAFPTSETEIHFGFSNFIFTLVFAVFGGFFLWVMTYLPGFRVSGAIGRCAPVWPPVPAALCCQQI